MIVRTAIRTISSIVAVVASSPAAGGDAVIVHELDEGLHVVGEARWDGLGTLPGGMHVLPGGEIAAIVVGGGETRLVRWDVRGHERFSGAVQLGGWPIRASRIDGSGALIVVTDRELVRLRVDDGAITGRRPLGIDPAQAKKVQASPRGAWLVFADRLLWAGLDGRRAERTLPVRVHVAPQKAFAAMLATERDECLLAEDNMTEHPVKGRVDPDVTTELVLSLLTRTGDVVGSATFGTARKRREWFWSEQTRGSTLPLPNDAGIVRTRWDGRAEIRALGEREDGDVVAIVWEAVGKDDERRQLVRLDHSLRVRWSRPYDGATPTVMSPPWAAGLLVHGWGRVRSYDEQGESERAGSYSYPRDVDISKIAGVALGRGPDGRWIVVEWTGK